ncbi:hypothetical protein [Brevundimonas nasdae]|uniref:Uncharacterized protein n=1 Tax=Brevundimonas nasdae TaxID=172043 RepID=A0ABX8TJW7_9CAUL|nr:hypothetical protein [Brevundimonas nasdae]QYC11506.1 hypothetical protein KWG56_05885 [Brevundimonas nasdae]QYC14294.1 hypothetical protein KWG63_01220 [Brevundimonas nasdae]
MTDVLDLLEDLEPRIASAKKSIAFGDAAERARRPVEQAPRHAALLLRLVQCVEDLDGFADAALRQRIGKAIAVADDLGGSLGTAANADDLDGVAIDYAQMNQALSGLTDRIKDHWSNLVNSDFNGLIAVGELLGKISGAEAIGAELVKIGQEARALTEPNTSQDRLIDWAPALRTRRSSTLEAMRAFTGQAEVDDFLAAVVMQTATLSLVTPTVLSWLNDRNALSAFNVRG